MPIRITDDDFIEIEQFNCPYNIDYSYNRNIKALQKILNVALAYVQQRARRLLTDLPINEDGIFGPKTKARKELLFADQYLSGCNLSNFLIDAEQYNIWGVTATWRRATIAELIAIKPKTDGDKDIEINTDVIPLDGNTTNSNDTGKAILITLAALFLLTRKW